MLTVTAVFLKWQLSVQEQLRNTSSSRHASTNLHEERFLPLNCGHAFTKAVGIGASCKLEKLGDWHMNPSHRDAVHSSRAASWF